jgi:hypothetical protein
MRGGDSGMDTQPTDSPTRGDSSSSNTDNIAGGGGPSNRMVEDRVWQITVIVASILLLLFLFCITKTRMGG